MLALRRRLALVALLPALALAVPAQAKPVSFRTAGQCVHLSASLLVDAAAASELVGKGFTVLEPVPGKAVLALVIQDCTSSVDGGASTRAMLDVVFVFVDPVRSPAGCQTYDFFWTTSRNNDWHRAMKAIGMEMGLAPQGHLTVHPPLVGGAVSAVNGYPAAPYAYAGTAVDAVAPEGPLPSVHCHLGPHGIVRQTYDHSFRAGTAVLDVTLGKSALWDHLGATGTTTGALLARFTWTGVTEIVAPT